MSSDSSEKITSEYQAIGFIVKPHGLRGDVVFVPYRGIYSYVRAGSEPVYFVEDEKISLTILNARPHKYRFILKFNGINDIGDCQKILKKELFALSNDLEPQEAESLFFQNAQGATILNKDGREVGIVKGLIETAGHLVLEIKINSGGEIMIPVVDEFIQSVDVQEGMITISPPDGLFEIYDI